MKLLSILADMYEPGNHIPIKCYKGKKYFELSNHLGNVLAVVTDRLLEEESSTTSGLVDYFKADLVSSSDYYPGVYTERSRSRMKMDDRGKSGPAVGYRFGFNGQEKETEITGSESHYSAEFWMYDSRLGRRWNVDPITYPWQSSYAAFNNNPIYFNDPLGLAGEPQTTTVNRGEGAYSVAKRNGITPEQLAKANPDVFKNYDKYKNKAKYWANKDKNYMLHTDMKLNLPTPPSSPVFTIVGDRPTPPVNLSESKDPFKDVVKKLHELKNTLYKDKKTTKDVIKKYSHGSNGNYSGQFSSSETTAFVKGQEVLILAMYNLDSQKDKMYLRGIQLHTVKQGDIIYFYIIKINTYRMKNPISRTGPQQFTLISLRFPPTPEGKRLAKRTYLYINHKIDNYEDIFK